MKKVLCILLVLLLAGSAALAAPQLSGSLFDSAKQALRYLSSGEYERLVTLLPFSVIAPGADEWQRFAGSFSSLSKPQTKYAVAFWSGSAWIVAVPVHTPDSGSVEVMALSSEDGATFSGYQCASWSQIESACAKSDHVLWNEEYVGGTPTVVAD